GAAPPCRRRDVRGEARRRQSLPLRAFGVEKLQGRPAGAGVRFLEDLLAVQAARRARIGLQAGILDLAAAFAAGAVLARSDALARGLQFAKLGQVARDVELVEVLDQHRDRFVARVRRASGDLAEGLVARPGDVLPDLGDEGAAALVDQVLQLFALLGSECHGGSLCNDRTQRISGTVDFDQARATRGRYRSAMESPFTAAALGPYLEKIHRKPVRVLGVAALGGGRQ